MQVNCKSASKQTSLCFVSKVFACVTPIQYSIYAFLPALRQRLSALFRRAQSHAGGLHGIGEQILTKKCRGFGECCHSKAATVPHRPRDVCVCLCTFIRRYASHIRACNCRRACILPRPPRRACQIPRGCARRAARRSRACGTCATACCLCSIPHRARRRPRPQSRAQP